VDPIVGWQTVRAEEGVPPAAPTLGFVPGSPHESAPGAWRPVEPQRRAMLEISSSAGGLQGVHSRRCRTLRRSKVPRHWRRPARWNVSRTSACVPSIASGSASRDLIPVQSTWCICGQSGAAWAVEFFVIHLKPQQRLQEKSSNFVAKLLECYATSTLLRWSRFMLATHADALCKKNTVGRARRVLSGAS
jgi:hypothetical protein